MEQKHPGLPFRKFLLIQVTPEIEGIVEELSGLGVQGYNYLDPYRKAKLVSWLVEQVYDLAVFRSCMSSMPDKQSEMNKEKNSMLEAKNEAETDIEAIDTELKESETSLAETEAELEKDEAATGGSNRREAYQLKMKSMQLKKKIEGLQTKKVKLEQSIETYNAGALKISLKIPFLYHPIKLLGRDRHRNKYYFFSELPDKIYVEPAAEQNSLLDSSSLSWSVVATQGDLDVLKARLSWYGLREHKLLDSLADIEKHQHLKLAVMEAEENIEMQLQEALEDLAGYTSMYQPSHGQRRPKTRSKTSATNEPDIFIRDYFRQRFLSKPIDKRVSVEFLVEVFLEAEREFTFMLASINCEWITPENLVKWRQDMNSMDIEKICACLLILSDSCTKLRKYTKKAREERRVMDDSEESEAEPENEDEQAESQEEEGDEYDEVDESFADGRSYDPLLYKQSGKSAIFEFGFYRYKVKNAWRELVSTRHTAAGLYLAVSVYIEAITYYINKRSIRVEEKQHTEIGKVTWGYGKQMRQKYRQLCMSSFSKVQEEKPMTRKERLEQRHRGTAL